MQLHLSLPEELSLANVALLAESGGGGDGGGMFSIVILLMIPLAMYFLLIRPNRKRRQQQQQLQKSIEVGDEVLTNAGLYGFITGIEEDSNIVWLEIDDDVQVRVSRGALQGKVNTSETVSAGDGASRDDGDDDADADASANDGSSDDAASGGNARRGRPSLKGRAARASANSSEQAKPGDE